jgi:arylformamidase
MEIFDISRELSTASPPWPGDAPFTLTQNARIEEGASVNLGMISTSLHNGSHADAANHFEPRGATIEQADLTAYLGPAVVADLSANYRDGAIPQITVDDLARWSDDLKSAPRLLLKTNVWRDADIFPKQIPTIAPSVPEWLQKLEVKLLGFDVPSVDDISSKELVNHHALARAGIAIVESLDLSAVESGRYNFVGLPLKIRGGDGSPLRAVLWHD